ncbi:MAG: tRNA-2-methylthio-N6-dimethylallyladenosine synthase [Candidatus Dependentiae bacterium]|nr:tRNA-2-methylthio-N6-dimethylallyladenosine synthase [Candidatus Dependentiae bacterium]
MADSAGIASFLEGLGCVQVESESQADLIIINTCAIREKAEQKLYSYLGELVDFKKNLPYLKIGIIGCVASYRKQEMLKRFEYISFVSGARDERTTFLTYLADVIVQLQTEKQFFSATALVDDVATVVPLERDVKAAMSERNAIIPARLIKEGSQAAMGGTLAPVGEVKRSFINITTGCNNYCTFCIVPFTRGKETSYPLEDIVLRVTHEVAAGAKEITLIGQNVNSYTCPETGARFAALLEAVAQIPGEFWVRYVSPHPKDMTRDVLEAMARYPEKLCAWCHFPLQSGSSRILELMNRTYTKEEYLAQVALIRALVPGVSLSTDIIVGFPGETHEEYLETREVSAQVGFDMAYSFVYSRRKYTKAYSMGDTCSAEEKAGRLADLQEVLRAGSLVAAQRYVGKNLRVLVEKRGANGKLLARSSGNHRVVFDGDALLIGTFVEVHVVEAGQSELRGELISSPLMIFSEHGLAA